MGNKIPQSTNVLRKRLQRVAKWLDELAANNGTEAGLFQKAALTARANTCWQTAARLEGLADAGEMLWVTLANVSGGDWSQQSAEWQEAAARYRDLYFALFAPPASAQSVDAVREDAE